jgi:hypothetical protein
MTYSDVDHYHISEFPKSDFRTSLQNVWSLTIIMNRLGHSSPDRSPPPQTCRQLSMNIFLRAKNTEREKHATAVMTL